MVAPASGSVIGILLLLVLVIIFLIVFIRYHYGALGIIIATNTFMEPFLLFVEDTVSLLDRCPHLRGVLREGFH